MEPVVTRVGLVGCGLWGRYILRDLVALGCQVPVVARSDRSRQRAHEGGASIVVDECRHLPEVDGVIVSTPTSLHAATIRDLLGRRVPVFVEKPLCTSLDDARQLVHEAPDRLFVMDKWRYHPGIEMLRDISRSGELGPLQSLRTVRLQWGNRQADIDTSWHLAPHDVAIVLEILGEIPPCRLATAERTGDCVSTLCAVLGDDPWIQIEVSSRYARWCREVRLHCRDGVAVLDDAYSQSVTILRSGPDRDAPVQEQRPLSGEMPLLRELRAFVDHLCGGPPPRSSAHDGLRVVAAIEQMRQMACS